jgi:hypothetical protein
MYRMNDRWVDLHEWEDVPWPAGTANFCIKALAVDAGSSAADPIAAVGSPVLHQNYPNPFNPSTFLPFTLPTRMWCHLAVTDMRGDVVTVPVEGEFDAGTYRAVFDARALPAGMYVATLITEHGSVSRKLALVK